MPKRYLSSEKWRSFDTALTAYVPLVSSLSTQPRFRQEVADNSSPGCEALALSVVKEWHFDPLTSARAQLKAKPSVNHQEESLDPSQDRNSPYENRPIPKERSEAATVMAQGPVQDSAQTQGGMEFDMGAFF